MRSRALSSASNRAAVSLFNHSRSSRNFHALGLQFSIQSRSTTPSSCWTKRIQKRANFIPDRTDQRHPKRIRAAAGRPPGRQSSCPVGVTPERTRSSTTGCSDWCSRLVVHLRFPVRRAIGAAIWGPRRWCSIQMLRLKISRPQCCSPRIISAVIPGRRVRNEISVWLSSLHLHASFFSRRSPWHRS